ncbi:MAG TPA: hypothetical protein VIT02_05035 [Burkholderiaceae bacterium]
MGSNPTLSARRQAKLARLDEIAERADPLNAELERVGAQNAELTSGPTMRSRSPWTTA